MDAGAAIAQAVNDSVDTMSTMPPWRPRPWLGVVVVGLFLVKRAF